MTALPPNGLLRTIEELRRLEEPEQNEPIRLFVSFSYAGDLLAHDLRKRVPAVLFGNAIIEIEFEPCVQEHVIGLQDKLAEITGRQRVIVLHWQRIESR